MTYISEVPSLVLTHSVSRWKIYMESICPNLLMTRFWVHPYPGCQSLFIEMFRSRVIRNILHPPRRTYTFLDQRGFFSCGRCKGCWTSKSNCRRWKVFLSTKTSKTYKIQDFISYDIAHVVYVLQCLCGLECTGCTKKASRLINLVHIHNIEIGFKNHSFHYITGKCIIWMKTYYNFGVLSVLDPTGEG